jgi:hypothetical protein
LRELYWDKLAISLIDLQQLKLLEAFSNRKELSCLSIFHLSLNSSQFLSPVVYKRQYLRDVGSYSGLYSFEDRSTLHVIQELTDGSTYVGEILVVSDENKDERTHSMSGFGELTFENGGSYRGHFLDDLYHGPGLWTNVKGDTSEGYWVKGERTGVFESKFINGDVRLGDWLCGKMHGSGSLKYANGNNLLTANWVNGVQTGHAHMVYKGGGEFVGEMFGAVRSGFGTMKYKGGRKDGNVFTGNWLDDRPHGLGFMKYRSGDEYNGMWSEGSISGEGTMTYASGDVYTGEWDRNTKSGTGTLTFSHGARYEGQWRHDLPNGAGQFTDEHGVVQRGDFVNGMFVTQSEWEV